MRRYWIPKDACPPNASPGASVRLTGDVLHHIRDVCRQHKGSKFEVLIEGGQAHLVEIVSESKHESVAEILESRQIPVLAKPHIHLAISVPRFPVFEAVLEKAVELGVSEVHPLFSEFSFIRKQEDVFEKKRARFEKIVQGATQQTGRGELMPIHEPKPLEEALRAFNQSGRGKGLFAYEGPGQLTVRQAMEGIRAASPEEVWLFVGAEGGFSEREVQLFQGVGLSPVTLGSQVLRVETACVALVSVIKYDLDLMR